MSNQKSIFQDNMATWLAETMHISNPHAIAEHPYARNIVAMGTDAAPWLLEALRNEPRIGPMMLLHEMTGVNPIAPDDTGRVDKMTEAWLRWGRQNGHI